MGLFDTNMFKNLEESGSKIVTFVNDATARLQAIMDRLDEAHTKIDTLTEQLARLEAAHESIMDWIAESDDDDLSDVIQQTQTAVADVAGAAASVAEAASDVAAVADTLTEETTHTEEGNDMTTETTTTEVPALPVAEVPATAEVPTVEVPTLTETAVAPIVEAAPVRKRHLI